MTDDLIIHDDIIALNSNYISNKSLTFLIACLCHEMIHYYDRLFGEYCAFKKYTIITGIKKNIHNTLTFEDMKDTANNIGIKVIQEIPNNKSIDVLDKESVELLMNKAKEDGLILEGDKRIENAVDGITFFDNGCGGVINDFD